jgi:hypothetical protein
MSLVKLKMLLNIVIIIFHLFLTAPINSLANNQWRNSHKSLRIDCLPEAESPLVNITKFTCEKRNCIYDPNESDPRIPSCYINRENLGYKLIKMNNLQFYLRQTGLAPFPGEIKNLFLETEYLGRSIVHVKVNLFLIVYL